VSLQIFDHATDCVPVSQSENAGKHAGEIALLEPFKRRSRTVLAIDTVVLAPISAQKFSASLQIFLNTAAVRQ
jgi:hypothetical protein